MSCKTDALYDCSGERGGPEGADPAHFTRTIRGLLIVTVIYHEFQSVRGRTVLRAVAVRAMKYIVSWVDHDPTLIFACVFTAKHETVSMRKSFGKFGGRAAQYARRSKIISISSVSERGAQCENKGQG